MQKKLQDETCEFIKFAEDHVSRIKGKESYVRCIKNMLSKLKEFEKQTGQTLFTDSFTEEIVDNFIYYLQSLKPVYYRKQGLKRATINSYLKKLSYLLKKASLAHYPVHPVMINKLVEDIPDTVSLSIEELKRIQAVKLTTSSTIIRDIFLIGCYTGLRYSDYSRLTRFNFVGNEIIIRTKKTGEKVVIPIHPVVKEILEKYHYSLPALKTHQSFNSALKRICRKAGINAPITQEYIAGTEVVKNKLEKWQLICTHTARRSFATNAYLAGIPVFRIMLITGHRTQEAFFRYIRIRKEENAKELSAHPFFQ